VTRALVRKELKVLWASPLPYVLGAVLNATLGVLGWGQIAGRGQAVFQPIVPIAAFLTVLVAPILAARSVADEIRTGTLEILVAARVSDLRIVAGKYIALVVTLWTLLAPVGLFAMLLALWGDPDGGPIITGLAGLAIMAAAMAAIGLVASSLTSSQPVAAIGALFAVLVLWFAHVGSDALAAGGLVASLSLSERLRSFAAGVLDLTDLVFFASVIAGSLAAAVVALAARRWR